MTFKLTLKNALLFFAIGLLFELFLSFLWGQMLIPEYKSSVQVPSSKVLVKEMAAAETVYAKKADSLNRHGQKLQAELSITKTALKKANDKAAGLRNQVFKLLDERFVTRQSDTSDTICDSLAATVPILIAVSDEKDSLYITALNHLEKQVQNKDSTITLQGQHYAELKSAFTRSIDAQTALATDNNALAKTVKRQRAKNKILSAVFALFSGAAATYLLQR